MHAANPRLRMWQIAVVRGLVEAGRLDDARVHFEDLVGLDGVRLRDNQMFLPGTCTLAEVAVAMDDPARAAVVQRALAPYADRIATSGLAGISIGPVSHYVGWPPRRPATSRRPSAAAIGDRPQRGVRHPPARGPGPPRAGRVLTRRGETAAAAFEDEAARRIAASIGLVLPA